MINTPPPRSSRHAARRQAPGQNRP
jgi:hypothetical protein